MTKAKGGLDSVLALAEGEQLEFKRANGVKRAVETAVAFANTSGGVLVIGVEDARKATGADRLHGVEENPEAVDDLKRQLTQRITPALPPAHYIDLPCVLRTGSPGGVLAISIDRSADVHSLVDGGTYGRFGTTNRQLTAAEITTLSLRRGKTSAVDQPVDVDISLLDSSTWNQYSRVRGLTRPLPEALRHLGLAIKDQAGSLRPTRAAVLLFADEPGGLLRSKCAVRIFHYKGDRIEHGAAPNLMRPPQTAGGALIDQIRRAIEITTQALATGVQIGPLGFEIVQKYPLRVLKEAITNAVLHRDYRLSEDIHIRIFDTRVEVESPGTLPGSVTVAKIASTGSQPRNRALVDALREFPEPPNLDAGEGVRMMFDVMEKAGLFQPTFVTDGDGERESVRVTLRNQARPSIWDQVLDHLRETGTIGNQEIRKLLRTEDPTKASKLMRAWVEEGLLEVANPEAGKRSRRYRLPGTAAEPALFAFR